MNYWPQITAGGGGAAVLAALWRFLRSSTGSKFVKSLVRGVRRDAESLREALDNLSAIVTTQGESIEWLRGELDVTRAELDVARKALADRESRLEKENDQLRTRVAELELQVKALESALAYKSRQRKGTRNV